MIVRNSAPKFRMASEKYGFVEIKDEEALLMAETIMENDPELPINEVLLDLKCIDACLHAMKLQSVCAAMTRRTKAGYYRKDTAIWHTLNGIIDGRVQASKEINN